MGALAVRRPDHFFLQKQVPKKRNARLDLACAFLHNLDFNNQARLDCFQFTQAH